MLPERSRGLILRMLMIWLFLPWIGSAKTVSAEYRSICSLQGAGFSSPSLGESVTTRGVVFADLDNTAQRGFFLQAESCDLDPSTSDGIFIYLGTRQDVVSSGDEVEVTGVVQEYFGMTELRAVPEDVAVLSSGNPLPTAQELSPPFNVEASRAYFESMEGMHVSLDQGRVVGPTDANNRTWLVRADLGLSRVFHDDLAGTGEVVCVDDAGLFEITPQARVGDQVDGLLGALDFSFGVYCIELIAAPQVRSSPLSLHRYVPAEGSSVLWFDVATFNLANLFDTFDDPLTEDSVLSTSEYHRRLHKRALAIHEILNEPILLAVQEAENLAVVQDLIAQPEIQSAYQILWEDGPDHRGLDIAMLYRLDRAQVLASQVRQGCTTLVDGLGPDGNRNVINPHNAITCDSNGDGILDGNRLFSRPPLQVRLQICQDVCPTRDLALRETHESVELWMIVNHWKSKTEDTDAVQYTLPRRLLEAQFVAALIQEILISHPQANLIVLGDLNDHPDSQPVSTLINQGLNNLTLRIDKQSRYTYIYQGISQVLDHVLVRLQPSLMPLSVASLHVNSDYPYVWMSDAISYHRSSDHDPLLVHFGVFDNQVFLPLVSANK